MNNQSCRDGHHWLQLFAGLCVLLVLTLVIPVHAQNSQGTVLGHITDPTGAALPKANVVLTNVNTSVTRTTTTTNVGDYVFVNIPPGIYDIVVEAAGFKGSSARAVTVNIDATLRQNFALIVGAATEQVTVQAEAQMVQSDNASSGNVVPEKLILETPLSGRDFTNLLKLNAGAAILKGGSQLYWSQHGLNDEWSGVSINGARPESISYLVDGVSNNDQFFATAANVPGAMAIEEFKVQNGMYSAEYGQGAAQVNVAIKSGTNRIRGSIYDYLQNDAFSPSNPLNKWKNTYHPGDTPLPLKDAFKQNQYGFTLGGPLVVPHLYDGKNKTFWFFSYEAGRRRQSNVKTVIVPSLKERNGDFSDWSYQLYDPATSGGANPSGRLPFANNQIPAARFNPIAKKLLNYYPLPNIACPVMDTCTGNYQASLSKPFDTDNITFRADQNFGSRDRIFFTGILGEQKFDNPSVMPLSGEVKTTKNRLFSANWQHSFSPSVFNEFRLGYTYEFFHNGSVTANGPDLATQNGFQNVPNVPAFFGLPNITMDFYQTSGNSNSGWTQNNNNYQLVENLKIIHGRHTLTMGADIRRLMLSMAAGFGSTGGLSFNGAYTASDPATIGNGQKLNHGNSLADFLLGNPISANGPAPLGSDLFNVRATNWNFFFQDDWRLTPRLTVNLGLRYEIPPQYHSANGSGMSLDLTNGGGYVWADQNFVNKIKALTGINPDRIRCCVDDKLTQANHKNLAPRIGMAWRPFTTDRFVVRAGYGLFYDLYNRWYDLTQYDDNGLWTQVSADYSNPAPTGLESASPWTLNKLWAPPASDYSWFQSPNWYNGAQINWPKNKSPYTQQWTLDAQYALTQTLLLDVGYVGSHALHQPGYWYFNSAPMPTGPFDPCNRYRSKDEAAGDPSCAADANISTVDMRKPFKNLSASSYANANIFSSNYHALQVRLNQRFNHGLQYQLNYTWSKTMDIDSAINNVEGATGFLQDQHNLHGDYAPANFDQTHRLVANGSYELPVGKGRRWSLGPANWVVGGWNVGGVYTVASGVPFTLTAGFGGRTQAGTRGDIIRPNQVGNPSSGTQDIFSWFNTSAFVQPANTASYGNVGRNSLRGPYFMKTDLSFSKDFKVSESQLLKYRLEIFNFGSNWHSQPPLPETNLLSPNFGSLVPIDQDPVTGKILPASQQSGSRNLWKPRTIQMSLIYTF